MSRNPHIYDRYTPGARVNHWANAFIMIGLDQWCSPTIPLQSRLPLAGSMA